MKLMRPSWVILVLLLASQLHATDGTPRPEDLLIWSPVSATGPQITPYLKYQVETAWRQDDIRRKRFESIRDERELLDLQKQLRAKLLEMIGGLPAEKTPLRPKITGKIQMQGFHIEKLIYESLPGIYVTALLYVPDGGGRHPAILVPCGHAANGKIHYQALAQRLVQRGYVVISWDPVGQGERSQFWEAKQKKSRYNLICAEHAVMGNLAYLAGANLARWEVWDGIRAVDYLLTRPEVDPDRINITGTSGGGTQAALIAALDPRIKAAAPSCYITSLPMRMFNRIFQDPDSDPEQDLYGMISSGMDHAGLLLLMYPRPVFVASAVLDFFPIEGAHKSFREAESLYRRFGHADRIGMTEGYHGHQYSPENQAAAFEFLDRFNGLHGGRELPPVKELADAEVQSTRSGQVMVDFENARSLMDEIREYYIANKSNSAPSVNESYFGENYPGIKAWPVKEFDRTLVTGAIACQASGSAKVGDFAVDKYLLHHSEKLAMPVLHIYKPEARSGNVLLWFSAEGKVSAKDWPAVARLVESGYEVVSFDFRGLGETRMPYKAVSQDDPELGKLSFDEAYVNPISSVLADYVYNSLLVGRPYFLQMMEDAEIASRFAKEKLKAKQIAVSGREDAALLVTSIAATFPDVKVLPRAGQAESGFSWSKVVEQKQEVWPIQFLMPAGARIPQ
jgi:pimeloyl-ACP methyl ester carboxylesterase